MQLLIKKYFRLKYDRIHSKHFLLFPSSVTDGKWLAGNKLSWYPVLLNLTIQFCSIKRRFIDDYLYQKLLILVQLCWKYFRISQGSGFLRHSVQAFKLQGLLNDRPPTARVSQFVSGRGSILHGHRCLSSGSSPIVSVRSRFTSPRSPIAAPSRSSLEASPRSMNVPSPGRLLEVGRRRLKLLGCLHASSSCFFCWSSDDFFSLYLQAGSM